MSGVTAVTMASVSTVLGKVGPDLVIVNHVVNGPGIVLFGGHLSAVGVIMETATMTAPSTATSGVMYVCVLVGPVFTVTGSVSMSTYSTSTLAINILANFVCLMGFVPPVVDVAYSG